MESNELTVDKFELKVWNGWIIIRVRVAGAIQIHSDTVLNRLFLLFLGGIGNECKIKKRQ